MHGAYSCCAPRRSSTNLSFPALAGVEGCRHRPYLLRVLLVVSARARACLLDGAAERQEGSDSLSQRRGARSFAALPPRAPCANEGGPSGRSFRLSGGSVP